jgi:hypothetical protein
MNRTVNPYHHDGWKSHPGTAWEGAFQPYNSWSSSPKRQQENRKRSAYGVPVIRADWCAIVAKNGRHLVVAPPFQVLPYLPQL